jgi:CheY-like chemotaxis protein
MVQELIAAKEKAEDSDRLKSAFLANISHEIRTPMNAIVGFSDLLLMPGLESEKQELYAGIIKQRSFDLLNIINDILDISIIEAGQMKINEEPCNIGEVLSDIYLNCKVIWIDSGKSNVSLSYNNQLIEKGIRVITDSKRLRQILLNLLGNAFKFTSDGSIEYGCMLKENDTILFYVSDTGIGIEPSKKDIIFQRFRQAEDTTTRLYGGAGLGLSISKGLLELMGGNIWVDSEQGKGSTFYFTIPYKLTEIIPEQMISTQEPAFHWGNKKMLIVEDDKYNAEYLKAVLYVTGIQITHVVYGEEALNLLKSDHNFDLLLLDIKLPDIDGYELARKIKSFCSKIPIIAETAYASEDHKERCFEAGCDDYLSKPTSKSDLMTIMSKHLQ